MARNLISWTRDWTPQDYTGFSNKQISNAKRIYKKLARLLINAEIKKLGYHITYKLSWVIDKNKKSYFLQTITNPPTKEITKTADDGHGGGGSTVSPTAPPKP
jgi:hypothetical protein